MEITCESPSYASQDLGKLFCLKMPGGFIPTSFPSIHKITASTISALGFWKIDLNGQTIKLGCSVSMNPYRSQSQNSGQAGCHSCEDLDATSAFKGTRESKAFSWVLVLWLQPVTEISKDTSFMLSLPDTNGKGVGGKDWSGRGA